MAQHQIEIKARIDFENKTIEIQQELEYKNNTPDTLTHLVFNNWINAYSSKTSHLAKRFSDEFVRSFHLAPESDRGFSEILNCSDENFTFLNW